MKSGWRSVSCTTCRLFFAFPWVAGLSMGRLVAWLLIPTVVFWLGEGCLSCPSAVRGSNSIFFEWISKAPHFVPCLVALALCGRRPCTWSVSFHVWLQRPKVIDLVEEWTQIYSERQQEDFARGCATAGQRQIMRLALRSIRSDWRNESEQMGKRGETRR